MQPFVKVLFFAIVFMTSLAACAEKQTQLYIFTRYNSETEIYDYYQADLYAPSFEKKINVVPCSEDGKYEPTWSPNGRYYGCSTNFGRPLFIYDTITNKVIAKTEPVNPKDPINWYMLGWSPDSQYASIMSTGSTEKPYYDFSIMKFDGSELIQIDKQSRANILSGEWSPNGKLIAHQIYMGDRSYLAIFQSNGKEIVRLDLNQSLSPTIFAEEIKWSPDSKKLAIRTLHNIDTDSHLYIWDIESSKVSDLVSDKSVCIMRISDWSPNGKTILFYAVNCNEDDYLNTVLYSINVDGSNIKKEDFKSLRRTPDGKSIIIDGMYLMDIDGKNKRKIFDNKNHLVNFVSWIIP